MSPRPSALQRNWDSDEAYVESQDKDSSWSHLSLWGHEAARKFAAYGLYLGKRLCHDDTAADFGGNDGTAAHAFYRAHGIKPLVIDCEPKRLEYAESAYGLPTLRCFLEDMSALPSGCIDWGFCSHTLEHVRDQHKVLREIRRVVKRGCGFIVPLESHHSAEENEAHTFHCETLRGWRALLEECGWRVVEARKSKVRSEAHLFAEPA